MRAMSEMEGTYTKRYGKEYTFVHDSMFEITARHFGRQSVNLEIILEYMDSSYIANCVKPLEHNSLNVENENESRHVCSTDIGSDACRDRDNSEKCELVDLRIIDLPVNMYPVFTKRLYNDIENMKLYDVFMNVVLKHPPAIKAFIDILQTKKYSELSSLFFSE